MDDKFKSYLGNEHFFSVRGKQSVCLSLHVIKQTLQRVILEYVVSLLFTNYR